MRSLLQLIEAVDGFTYSGDGGFTQLVAHDGTTAIGLVNSDIASLFKQYIQSFEFEDGRIIIKPEYDTLEKRSDLFETIAQEWRKLPQFEEQLDKGWRNELYVIYNPTAVPYLRMERAFSVLTGVVTYGVHINGYVRCKSTGEIKMWIPRRSATKPTYPNMLDNTVAGGLGYPYGLYDTVIKECFEEAGLPKDFVVANTKPSGVVLYMYLTSDNRVQPEVEYIYDIEFPDETTTIPNPQDGEAVDFKLLTVDQILHEIYLGSFKPNCALVIIDFLIRFGIITPENEPNYLEIVSRCHRKIPFPTM